MYMKPLIMIFTSLSLIYHYTIPAKYEKKINREIEKIWDASIEKERIIVSENTDFNEEASLFKLKSKDTLMGFLYFNKVNACKKGGCDSNEDFLFTNKYDHFYYLAVFDPELLILKVKIIEYQSDYGYEITGRGWLKQFNKKNVETLNYGEEIDAISGATVSANSLLIDMQRIHTYLKEIHQYKFIKK